MIKPRNIVLIGLRGSGKTSVARELAGRLQREHIDTDELLQRRAQAGISELFAKIGEAGFRALEQAAIVEALADAGRVISVGGGAVQMAENRTMLRTRATCVWLTAPVEVLCERVRSDPLTASTRPMLTTLDPMDEMRALLAVRGPLYSELAACTVDTGRLSIAQVVEAVCEALGSQPGAQSP